MSKWSCSIRLKMDLGVTAPVLIWEWDSWDFPLPPDVSSCEIWGETYIVIKSFREIVFMLYFILVEETMTRWYSEERIAMKSLIWLTNCISHKDPYGIVPSIFYGIDNHSLKMFWKLQFREQVNVKSTFGLHSRNWKKLTDQYNWKICQLQLDLTFF